MAKQTASAKKVERAKVNKSRKERYHSDPDYRQAINKRNRERYRKDNGVLVPYGRDITYRAGDLKVMGTRRKVEGLGKRLTFSAREAAAVLDCSEQTLYRQIWDGRIPPMMYTADAMFPTRSGERVGQLSVYTEKEMRAISKELHNHYKEFSYYRACHEDTIYKVFEAADKAREGA